MRFVGIPGLKSDSLTAPAKALFIQDTEVTYVDQSKTSQAHSAMRSTHLERSHLDDVLDKVLRMIYLSFFTMSTSFESSACNSSWLAVTLLCFLAIAS